MRRLWRLGRERTGLRLRIRLRQLRMHATLHQRRPRHHLPLIARWIRGADRLRSASARSRLLLLCRLRRCERSAILPGQRHALPPGGGPAGGNARPVHRYAGGRLPVSISAHRRPPCWRVLLRRWCGRPVLLSHRPARPGAHHLPVHRWQRLHRLRHRGHHRDRPDHRRA